MSSTADRWFVPDEEYYESDNDYALVRHSAAAVRKAILDVDEVFYRTTIPEDTFMTEFAGYEPCYNFAVDGQLVYADVDDQDPTHMETVYGKWAKEISIEQESERTVATKKDLVKACVDVYFPPSEFYQDDEEHTSDGHERKRWTVRELKGLIRKGAIDDPIVSLILTTKSVQDKEEILNIMSNQSRRPTKRPVIALIDMVDSKQTTEVGESKGWVTAYDFINELLVIKPFVSNGGNHPLGGKWYGDVANDGVSFSGTLQEFTKAYNEFGNTVDAGNKDDGFKMLVHTLAAAWIISFGTELETAYGAEFHDDLSAMQEATAKITKAMDEIKIPVVEKIETKYGGTNIKPFSSMLSMIESDEANIRDDAVDAKERGEEKIAQNTAKLYEYIHKLIEAFNKNPTMDLDF